MKRKCEGGLALVGACIVSTLAIAQPASLAPADLDRVTAGTDMIVILGVTDALMPPIEGGAVATTLVAPGPEALPLLRVVPGEALPLLRVVPGDEHTHSAFSSIDGVHVGVTTWVVGEGASAHATASGSNGQTTTSVTHSHGTPR